MEITEKELPYLKLLARQYPTIQAAATEIINLNAILNLPKGTEHFVTDIHGEFEAFLHVLRNGSGSIKRKIEETFADALPAQEKRSLATLIYYPEQKIPLTLKIVENEDEWCRLTLFRLIKMCRVVSSKYTRSKVRKALPPAFAYIIEELLHEQESVDNKLEYYQSIIQTIIATGRAKDFIIALSKLLQRLVIDRLHVIGDIFDRGPGAHIIMDALMDYHAVDIQWGNHDIVWMGAAAGSEACLANVIRNALRYSTVETLENGYGINLLPLASFAVDVYGADPCIHFQPKPLRSEEYTENELRLMAQMHKAITIIQLKLEAQIIKRRPHYLMEDRLLLDKIDYTKGTIRLEGKVYPLQDTHLPTIDPAQPYQLTEQEQNVVERLKLSFTHSERLQKHVRFLYARGSLYLVYNGNLLYHGCIAMNEDGSFMAFKVGGEEFAAKAFMDRAERLARQGYFAANPEQRQYGQDAMWYLWSGAQSPLFGKDKMSTFERYFIADKSTHEEKMNPYYDFRDKEETARRILQEFGLDPDTAHIINGHVPVKVKKGESPIKAGGRLFVIDGGFAKAYQSKTGIAGYTLIYNSYGLLLAAHDPFESTQKAIEEEQDIHSKTEIVETNYTRIRVKDTDLGREMQQEIHDLQQLLHAYRIGVIKET
ncbi:MAG: fructose-1,6-bisphosphatase class 3 [Chloroflexota bacterium]|nr:MAG: fructose-1,6-bisphosphatase class 3 [Chloroflexota bacterium]